MSEQNSSRDQSLTTCRGDECALATESLLERAIRIALEAHRGQTDKADQAYIMHPLRVMFALKGERDRMVGVLHDVLEDCPDWSPQRLFAAGIPEDVIQDVARLTRERGETYAAFIERVGEFARPRRVKIADLTDNMDLSRLPEITDADVQRTVKYREARLRLLALEARAAIAAAREQREHSSPRQVAPLIRDDPS